MHAVDMQLYVVKEGKRTFKYPPILI